MRNNFQYEMSSAPDIKEEIVKTYNTMPLKKKTSNQTILTVKVIYCNKTKEVY